MLPRLVERGDGWWHAVWVPLRLDVDVAIDRLVASMPAVVGAGERDADRAAVARSVVESLVDQIARATLAYSGWQLGLGDTRRHVSRALRQVMRALQAPSGRFRDERDLVDALDQIADAFDTIIRRAEGEPVVRVRLRLGVPDGPEGMWPLAFEVADAASGDVGVAATCTLADVRAASPAAVELAGGTRHVALVQQTADDALADLSLVAPWLEHWIDAGCDDGIDIDQAAATLEAVDLLAAVRIDLVSPERLARRRPSTRGTARPADEGSQHRFGATALVDWSVVVDDTPIDEAVLRRAADAGASLVQVGGRWVQLDRTDARRALDHLARHRDEHAELSALELLQVSAELQAAEEAAASVPGAAMADQIVATGWLDDLMQGLPDATLVDGDVPATFAATLRPYQLRGLGWLQFLRRVGLGGCLADDMGLGKTPTTLAHLAGIPGPHLVVCPLSVVHNWETECARFVPFARVLVHHGSGRADATSFAARVAHHDIVVTTYQLAARDLDAITAVSWSTVVLAEAQAGPYQYYAVTPCRVYDTRTGLPSAGGTDGGILYT
ncbi:MAG: hypothetical protein HZB15_16120, partial [Actinobacteria bacterium]|nr:hypothetical protein [Actinomycetota bacterium]